jgi:uncharacterized membrane protein
VLEFPLGIATCLVGVALAVLGVSALREDWKWLGLVAVGPVLVVFGALGLIHAVTGCLPAWVVGWDDVEPSEPDAPAA